MCSHNVFALLVRVSLTRQDSLNVTCVPPALIDIIRSTVKLLQRRSKRSLSQRRDCATVFQVQTKFQRIASDSAERSDSLWSWRDSRSTDTLRKFLITLTIFWKLHRLSK